MHGHMPGLVAELQTRLAAGVFTAHAPHRQQRLISVDETVLGIEHIQRSGVALNRAS